MSSPIHCQQLSHFMLSDQEELHWPDPELCIIEICSGGLLGGWLLDRHGRHLRPTFDQSGPTNAFNNSSRTLDEGWFTYQLNWLTDTRASLGINLKGMCSSRLMNSGIWEYDE